MRSILHANFAICLLRLAAAAIDLALLVALALITSAPIVSLGLLVRLGYLENFKFFFTPAVTALQTYLIVSAGGLIFFSVYYPCRFESSEWQGTLGKHLSHLRCSDEAGERERFFQVAWRLTLQAALVTMLGTIAVLVGSQPFHDLVVPIAAALPFGNLPPLQRGWTTSIAPAIALFSYSIALFTPKNQTLIDLMARRITARQRPGEKPSFKLLTQFIRILLPDCTPAKRKVKGIAIGAMAVLASFWLASATLFISALFTLPASMLQVDRLFKEGGEQRGGNQTRLQQYRRTALFKHLDRLYYWLGRDTRTGEQFSRTCLSKAIFLDPDQHRYWYRQAQNRMAEERYSDALKDVSQAIKLYDGSSTYSWLPDRDNVELDSLYALRAILDEKLGDQQAAFADLTRAVNSTAATDSTASASIAGHARYYKKWMKLGDLIDRQNDARARTELKKANAIAKQAAAILQKSPARFKEKQNIYNQMLKLNNAGVVALLKNDYNRAIERFQMAVAQGEKLQDSAQDKLDDSFEQAFREWQTALGLDGRYNLASRNLSIAYNNKAKATKNPREALKYFHRALYIDPLNEPAQFNTSAAIKEAGLDPDSFNDHIKLAEIAIANQDLEGGVVEYKLALNISSDAETEKKLQMLLNKLAAQKPGRGHR